MILRAFNSLTNPKQAIELFPFFVTKCTLVVIVYDVTTELTVSSASEWLKELNQVLKTFRLNCFRLLRDLGHKALSHLPLHEDSLQQLLLYAES